MAGSAPFSKNHCSGHFFRGTMPAVAQLVLHDFHQNRHARFTEVNGAEVVADYGDAAAEYAALRAAAGVLDLSCRGRLCLTGADRQRFLNGQVTNNVKDLKSGEGCYAAILTPRGKMQSDLNIYCLPDELLLDLEPGYAPAVSQWLEKYIIADDVQLVDVSPHYGLLSVQGPRSADVAQTSGLNLAVPDKPMNFTSATDAVLGEFYLVNHPRVGAMGFDLFVPTTALRSAAEKLVAAANSLGGCACGWQALEIARVEDGRPRFGADMDENNLPPEAGIETQAISYTKGCYTGQEVIARIRTYGQVAKSLRGLRLADDLKALPARGDKLFKDGKEVGHITSAVKSPLSQTNLALGYVHRTANNVGAELILRTGDGESPAKIVQLPFEKPAGRR